MIPNTTKQKEVTAILALLITVASYPNNYVTNSLDKWGAIISLAEHISDEDTQEYELAQKIKSYAEAKARIGDDKGITEDQFVEALEVGISLIEQQNRQLVGVIYDDVEREYVLEVLLETLEPNNEVRKLLAKYESLINEMDRLNTNLD